MKPPAQWIEEYGNGGPDNDGYLTVDATLPMCGELIGLSDMYRMVQEDALTSAKSENFCKNCKHWSLPSWETNGFGTCSLNTARDEQKPPLPDVWNLCGDGDMWLATHESFGCDFHEPREQA